jgi:hypothetical protein
VEELDYCFSIRFDIRSAAAAVDGRAREELFVSHLKLLLFSLMIEGFLRDSSLKIFFFVIS